MKLLTTTVLAASFCLGAVFPAGAGNTVGTVKAWQYMQADGWKSADGMDDNTLHNMLYQASVIDNYPWTKQFLLRVRGGGAYFLADKKTHTVRKLNVKPASGYYSDLTSVYQAEDQGKGCYFTIIDTQYQLELANEPHNTQVLAAIPENCVNKKQQAALAAKRSASDQKLQQWVAQQSLAELCRRTGNC
ncbi:hypothetical protein [Raoultella ornithinolytica]|uniref:hypothetical protein n=1 Tax=Raoultella ornithinolytica TaxID=54291 RepID=UPI0015DCDAF6|nr:hypothetical protein [Raoultella ornithinolytica]BBQ91632.1 hypothetical protein WP3W18E06_47600 [Raoultella ornithinolytica]